ncbi:2276_t:CDS:2 [Funneliformis geosporum]|nr:2276_t:CDS:2 [Funneliformis geosporum]
MDLNWSIVNADDKELLIFELSRAPTCLPTRHPEGDKVKLDRCMIDVLNNLLEEYKTCEFTLAKEFKVFGFQIKDELIKSLGVLQRLKIAKARKPDPIDPVSSYILRLPPS